MEQYLIDTNCRTAMAYGYTLMTNSTALLDRGIRCLNNELGILDAERFVALILREPFDYTEWRKNNLFVGMSIDEIIDEADEYCKENKKP